MIGERRKFNRLGEDGRRAALIAAAIALISEGGPATATVRAIAERAGVTPGLIRHYFTTKEALMRAAYAQVMDAMTQASVDVLASTPNRPQARLAVFVAASLRPPVVDSRAMGLWAGFLHQMREDSEMRAVHEASYLHYRDLLQGLIAALPRVADAGQLRADAIACNAVIDGLWLEGSALPDAFRPGELVRIGLRSVSAILGLDLMAEMPERGI
ncbi:TetR/AcrR family transcriptional regulator [Pseudorhodobacter ferrugineus]|uniref:TetR/AcrR family transcriptional regulator n=1 Tax=Pseudorhodobacter ferrugineus TaxID=77008 RepID=UPI0003B5E531|nr:TetR family transcriptional regulator C-terminal domain-containing protein [Pseudorhodobacter ferrugineus]